MPVRSVLRSIERTILRYRMFDGVRNLGVAVSGGADSVCLLHALAELAPRYRLRLSVLHLDHGLRGAESRADAEFVRALAQSLGLPFRSRTVDLSNVAGNLEQEARRARLEFFAGRIAAGEVERVATAHTRSDQAETVLFRILRGAAGAGLAGIRPVTTSGLVRPLIDTDRADVVRYLAARRLAWREDSTNLSPDFARNRIRHTLLPQLAREWNPAIARTLAHLADWAGEEERWRGGEAARLAADHLYRRDGALLLRAAVLQDLPRAAARRLVRCAVAEIKGDLRAVDFEHVEAVLSLAHDPRGGMARLPGLVVCRSFEWIRFAPPVSNPPWRVPVSVPGCVAIPGTGLSISLEIVDISETTDMSRYVYNSEMGCLDWKLVSGSAALRSWHAGDRYQPMGAAGESKLKEMFQRGRVPVWERAGWPVLEAGERIAWSRRFGAAAWCAAGPETSVVLRVLERDAARKTESE